MSHIRWRRSRAAAKTCCCPINVGTPALSARDTRPMTAGRMMDYAALSNGDVMLSTRCVVLLSIKELRSCRALSQSNQNRAGRGQVELER